MPHLATPLGIKDERAFQSAYWRNFERFFGSANFQVAKAMLLAKNERADTGDGELDRVCLGLRRTLRWIAELIERAAIKESGLT